MVRNSQMQQNIWLEISFLACRNGFYLSKHKNFWIFPVKKEIWFEKIFFKSNLYMLTRLIYLVKTQIQIILFEFSCQSKNSNKFAGNFLSKHRWKWIYLILSVKHKIQLNYLDFSCQKANLIRKNLISNL